MKSLSPYIEAYGNREVSFPFRSRSYLFSLSLELFSSAGIDTGSRFLLKVFSDFLNSPSGGTFLADFSGASEPRMVLDAGSGVGVLGICAAGALSALVPEKSFLVHAQDRDELARIFTEYNARRNGLTEEYFRAHAAPLLAETPGALRKEQRWDLILTNIPAKAGRPVLEDFIGRSAALLTDKGRVFLVAVNTLADFFRAEITRAASLLQEENGKEHTVFVYGRNAGQSSVPPKGPLLESGFPRDYPFYIRNRNIYEMENISYALETVEGAPGFDNPGGAAAAAAKLAVKIDLPARLPLPPSGGTLRALILDAGQGHFALWLSRFPGVKNLPEKLSMVLSGRNIVALSAAKAALNAPAGAAGTAVATIPGVDIFLDAGRLAAAGGDRAGFSFIAYSPETMPAASGGTGGDPRERGWKGVDLLAATGAVIIVSMTSAGAERFDRKKPPGWQRIGDIKRKGFRAMAYLKI